jgi:hypothetical protein
MDDRPQEIHPTRKTKIILWSLVALYAFWLASPLLGPFWFASVGHNMMFPGILFIYLGFRHLEKTRSYPWCTSSLLPLFAVAPLVVHVFLFEHGRWRPIYLVVLIVGGLGWSREMRRRRRREQADN